MLSNQDKIDYQNARRDFFIEAAALLMQIGMKLPWDIDDDRPDECDQLLTDGTDYYKNNGRIRVIHDQLERLTWLFARIRHAVGTRDYDRFPGPYEPRFSDAACEGFNARRAALATEQTKPKPSRRRKAAKS